MSLACPNSTRALVALMDMEAALGGAASHFGGPAAFAEILSATYGWMFLQGDKQGRPWHELFHFVNDAGHCENGIYALKANYSLAGLSLDALRGFRSLESRLTGHGEAHVFPESVYISNGPLGSSLGPAQGLALAEGMRKNLDLSVSGSRESRTTVVALSDGACMEGEARESLASIPGWAARGQMGPFVCVVSDNNTKLSGRIDQDSFSMAPTLNSMETLGWRTHHIPEGHNIQKVYEALSKAFLWAKEDPTAPHFLCFKTIKGRGVKAMESSRSGGHGFSLKNPKDISNFVGEIYEGSPLPQPIRDWVEDIESRVSNSSPPSTVKGSQKNIERVKIQQGVSEALMDQWDKGQPLVSVSADLQGSTGVAPFRKKHPQVCFEVGVAESNMVSVATGLSKQGYIPIVDTFAQFGVTKGALPLIMSGLSQAPIIAFYSHTGFQDAADGASHQCLTYLSMVSSIPKVDVCSLTCASEGYQLVSQAIERFAGEKKQGRVPRSVIFFLGRETFPREYSPGAQYLWGKAQIVSDNSSRFKDSVALVGVGSLLENTLHAQEILAQKNQGSIVVNPSTVNPLDMDTFKSILQKTKGRLVTVEDHRVEGGFGSLLCHALALGAVDFRIKSLGISDQFGRSAYKAQSLYKLYGLCGSSIAQAALEV